MNEVVRILPGLGKRAPDAMLECAKSANLDSVTIIGWSGEDFYLSSSCEFNKDILWDLKQTELQILNE